MGSIREAPFAGTRMTTISFPAARNEGLLVETVGDETVVYDLKTKEAHCLKPLAAVVFTHADGKTSAAEIAKLAEAQLREPITEAHIQDAIAQLDASALLDTPLVVHNGLSRRQMIGKSAAAAGALAGASLITSVMAPVASAQNSPLPPGACCGPIGDCTGGNPRCQSNHCCQDNKECNKCRCTSDANDCSSAKCTTTSNVGACPPVVIDGVPTNACATTGTSPGFQCCYPDPDSTTIPPTCCRGFVTGGGIQSCAPTA